MSRVVATIAVDDMGVDPLGVKEALVMAVEPLGGVQVLWMDIQEPEQLGLNGVAPPPPARPAPKPAKQQTRTQGGQAPSRGKPAPPQGGQAPADGSGGRRAPASMTACFTCARYSKSYGKDANGIFYWGTCANTGKFIYSLRDSCGVWKGKRQG